MDGVGAYANTKPDDHGNGPNPSNLVNRKERWNDQTGKTKLALTASAANPMMAAEWPDGLPPAGLREMLARRRLSGTYRRQRNWWRRCSTHTRPADSWLTASGLFLMRWQMRPGRCNPRLNVAVACANVKWQRRDNPKSCLSRTVGDILTWIATAIQNGCAIWTDKFEEREEANCVMDGKI